MAEDFADTTRDRIIEAAGEVFAAKGFEGATVREICATAGANIAAVNYYFGDKQKLYIEAVVRAHRWRMERAVLPDWDDSTPAEQKLADFILTFIRRVKTGPGDTWHTRLVMREILQPADACAEMARSSIRPQFEILQGILRELMPEEISDEKLHLLAFSIVGQCLFYHVAEGVVRNLVSRREYEGYDIETLAQHVGEFSLAGIARLRGDAKRALSGADR